MKDPEKDEHYKELLRAACSSIIKRGIAVGKEKFSTEGFPLRESQSIWMEKGGGGYGSASSVDIHTDMRRYWELCQDELEASDEWGAVAELTSEIIDTYGTPPAVSFGGDIDFETQLVEEYLFQVKLFEFDSKIADKLADELFEYLVRPTFLTSGVIALEGFKASKTFQLDSDIEFRPIHSSELNELGRGLSLDYIRQNTSAHSMVLPQDDWWICEIRAEQRKDDLRIFGSVLELVGTVVSALRVWQRGEMYVKSYGISRDGAFGPGGRATPRVPLVLSFRGGPYSLTDSDIDELKRFWPKFRDEFRDEGHFLKLPARRLEFGGQRERLDDAVIDYVIGLEYLLGRARTEVGYSLALRTAMISGTSIDDKKGLMVAMNKLYAVRSAIIHGSHPIRRKVEESEIFAEDTLRMTWKWFFDNFSGESDTTTALAEIDRRLLEYDS